MALHINEISPQQLRTRLDRGDDLVVVDLRQPWEHRSGHIPGAVNIFIQDIPRRLGELPRDRDVVFQCWHGVTSLDVAGFVMQQGWTGSRIASLSGGFAGWLHAHGPESLAIPPC